MPKLQCKNCGNKDKFLAKCVYSGIVDGKGKKLVDFAMDEPPEYQCAKCGSNKIKITFDKEGVWMYL